jgi:predicted amidohydrolase
MEKTGMTSTATPPSFRCGVVQLRSTDDLAQNLERATHWIRRAAADGAEVIALPENFAWLRIGPDAESPIQPLDGPVVSMMRGLGRELGVHLLLGSIGEPSATPGKHHNTSVWVGPDGELLATYRKLFLFDVDIKGSETHRESDHVEAGRDVVCVDTPWARFGLSICYDLRFPELYRRLTDAGATCLTVPAAFTLTTGKDHWHVLLRARAIENQCFVIAPGQWGHHGGVRRSYGHSVVIDPWGNVLADVGEGEGFAVARIDMERVGRVREQLPCLQHRRRDVG